MRQEMTGFWDAVASDTPYANDLHLAAERTTPTPHHCNGIDLRLRLTICKHAIMRKCDAVHENFEKQLIHIKVSVKQPWCVAGSAPAPLARKTRQDATNTT